MRILHVHWTALPVTGGVEVHCATVVHQLASLGVDAELLSGTQDADLGRHQAALQLQVKPTSRQLDELVDECRAADVVHWHNPQWHKPSVAAHVAGKLDGKVVFDLHNIDDRDDHWDFLARLSDHYIAHSDFVADELRRKLSGVRIDVLPLALDREQASYELPRAAGTVAVQPTRLTTWKGSDLSLRAVTDLLDDGSYDLAFVHAGSRNLVWPSNIPDELMVRVKPWSDRGLISFVHYSAAQSWSAIDAADLVLHPTSGRGTHGEPFSLSVAQAVICGKPVVASASGHLPALLASYSAAHLVPPGNQEALTEALAKAVRTRIVANHAGDRDLAERLMAAFLSSGERHLAFYRSRHYVSRHHKRRSHNANPNNL